MNPTGKVTAVIPAYNAAHSIGNAIDSVLAQTRPVDEVLVIDDGSQDETFEVASQYGDPVRVLQKPNGGSSSARNLGISECQGEWVAFLDSDDVWLPCRIDHQLAILSTTPSLQWVSGRFNIYRGNQFVGTSSLGSPPISECVIQNHPLSLLSQGCAIWTGTVLVRRSLLREVGGFDERQKTSHDFDLWFRLALATSQIGYVHEPIARYQVGNIGSLTGQSSHQGDRSWIRLIERFVDARSGCAESDKEWIDRLIKLKSNQIVRNTIKSANPGHARWLIRELGKLGVHDIAPRLRLLAHCPRPVLSAARNLFRRTNPTNLPGKPAAL